jgi:hypothetical protein
MKPTASSDISRRPFMLRFGVGALNKIKLSPA